MADPGGDLAGLRWGPGLKVSVVSEDGMIRVEPAAVRPPVDIAEFVARSTEKYDQALRNLCER